MLYYRFATINMSLDWAECNPRHTMPFSYRTRTLTVHQQGVAGKHATFPFSYTSLLSCILWALHIFPAPTIISPLSTLNCTVYYDTLCLFILDTVQLGRPIILCQAISVFFLVALFSTFLSHIFLFILFLIMFLKRLTYYYPSMRFSHSLRLIIDYI